MKAAILALLDEQPMHGYEMIKELEERTDGAWSPSAGSIYPALQMLEDQGLIRGEEIEGKRRFTLTDDGRQQLASREGPAPWETIRQDAGESANLKEAMQKLVHTLPQVFRAGSESQQKEVAGLLDETRKRVYAILARDD